MKKKRELIINPDDKCPQVIELQKSSYRIGRDKKCDICLDSKAVSSVHCSLLIEGDSVWVLDLNSTNGTYLNDKKINKEKLKNGDVLKIGDILVKFLEKEEENLTTKTYLIYKLPQKEEEPFDISSLLQRIEKDETIDKEMIRKLVDELELHKRNSVLLDTLYSILEKIISITERDEAITTLLKELQALIGLEISSIYLVKEKKFGILENSILEWSDEYPVVSKSVLKKVIETKTPLVLDVVDNEDDTMKTLIRFKIKQALCFPVLQRQKEVIAVVYFVSREGGKLEVIKHDTHFIKAVSNFIAIILEYLSLLEKEKEAAYLSAKKSDEQHYAPIISKLREEKENLSLKLKALKEECFFGLDFKEYSELRQFIERASPTGLPILIYGETGVGKTLFAKAIHNFGKKDSPFVVIDCTTIPKELLESELFGYEKGAFTGATSKKAGKVSLAEGGTLFIDEIGELELSLQAKLLRFIQSGEYEALGSSVTKRSNARIIAATNRDLRIEVAQKRFREDLFYRLNVLTIQLPPLRTRPEMILRFAEYFLNKYKVTLNPKIKGFSEPTKNLLISYSWPGNIRELENCIMRALVNAEGELIEVHHCALYNIDNQKEILYNISNGNLEMDLKAARERIDRILISRALEITGRNVSRSAEVLNISRNALMELIKKYGL